ncbi:hypothetical protein SAMN04488096_107102 [Mesonia phycicola]|uniref:N-acetyltransferase domain-containing protein n=1 Tax=Mesonia phycicola TaxID=579105 RepID=A0A1M6G3D4_9FLAO|nr:GNAT family N-acetyltransferase [Mesonia phycicola]SHJ04357.1 hypothetical protein SAMN04488096_107102 [Mesonia phycicola]
MSIDSTLEFCVLNSSDISKIVPLGHQLNPKLSKIEIEDYLKQMFQFSTYHCFGLKKQGKLVGLSSGWITIRFYSGKQLEVDNVIIDQDIQSKGYGKYFFEKIEEWAIKNECNSVELNTYLENKRSHKFYYTNNYSVLGFHFCKNLKK